MAQCFGYSYKIDYWIIWRVRKCADNPQYIFIAISGSLDWQKWNKVRKIRIDTVPFECCVYYVCIGCQTEHNMDHTHGKDNEQFQLIHLWFGDRAIILFVVHFILFSLFFFASVFLHLVVTCTAVFSLFLLYSFGSVTIIWIVLCCRSDISPHRYLKRLRDALSIRLLNTYAENLSKSSQGIFNLNNL